MLKIERPKPYKRIGLGAAALVVGFIGSYSLFSSMEPAEDTGEVLSSQTEQREDAAQDSRDKTESQAKQQTQTDGSATTTDSAAPTSWSPQPAFTSPQSTTTDPQVGTHAASSPESRQSSTADSDSNNSGTQNEVCDICRTYDTVQDTAAGVINIAPVPSL